MMAIFRLCSGNMNRKWELMNEKEGFNSMIKKVINNNVLNYAIGLADDMGDWLYVRTGYV